MPELRDSSNHGSGKHTHHCKEYDSYARIFGLETEYGVSVTETDQSCDPGQVAMMMFAPVLSRSRTTNTYLENGSRLYLDVGSHPEYATAEARDPSDALVQDLAGESIMRQLVDNAQAQLRKTHGPNATIHLFKNNADSAGHSFGCHENYLVRRYVSLPAVNHQLLPFLVTRQIFTGAGLVNEHGFEITQRAMFLEDGVSSSTTRSRPMVNTRDEPHANPDEFRRLHVILGDSNRSQWATIMKLATTHLVLCVIEDAAKRGIDSGFEACSLSNPSAANQAMSTDLSCHRPVMALENIKLFRSAQQRFHANSSTDCDSAFVRYERNVQISNAETVSALEIQYLYWYIVAQFIEKHTGEIQASLPETSCLYVLNEWKHALDALNDGQIASLSDRVDWIAKHQLINQMSKRNPMLSSVQQREIDLNYHDITNGTIYPSLVHHKLMNTLVSDDAVQQALTRPPADTRAALRGTFIRCALRTGVSFSCDWTHLKTTVPVHGEAEINDPFDYRGDAQYAGLIESMKRSEV
ncbi:proteasome accessory factor PafA2 family protein [Bifidobacterium commune]|uniref:Proteasome accessory factor A n=1 Tax=Bifidobacterium commune TaxID=1505727 RepID=A0A1C4H0W6_9BIFI|nr:proteasome accessory factor A [Bifidobacterium commune]